MIPVSKLGWHAHLQEHRKNNPGKTLKECMVEAAVSYKKELNELSNKNEVKEEPVQEKKVELVPVAEVKEKKSRKKIVEKTA